MMDFIELQISFPGVCVAAHACHSQGHLRLLASIHSTAHATANTVAELTTPRHNSAAVLDPVPRVNLDPSARPLDLAGLPARLLQPFLEGYPASELAWLERHAQERVSHRRFSVAKGSSAEGSRPGMSWCRTCSETQHQHSCDCSSLHRKTPVRVVSGLDTFLT